MAETPKWTDRAVVVLTVAIILVSLWQGFIFRKQWQEMDAAGKQTDQLIRLSNESSIAAKRAADATVSTSQATIALAKSTAVANQQQREFFLQQQRAWVGIGNLQAESPTPGGMLHASVLLKNVGKTPARDVKSLCGIGLYNAGREKPEFTSHGNEPGSRDYVTPDATVTLDCGPQQIFPTYFDAIQGGKMILYIHAYTVYHTMGHVGRTDFCAFYRKGNFVSCQFSNDMK